VGAFVRTMQSSTVSESFPARGPIPRADTRRLELLAFAALLSAANLPLFIGGSTSRLAFLPDTVAAGEWWRLLTHPFAHVSWYHLLLDGSAFLFLYAALRSESCSRRLGAVAACALGSVFTAWLACPAVAQIGLSGLSGVAHGLMAIIALEIVATAHRTDRWLGWTMFAVVAGKALVEALTGHAILGALHFGLLGTPIAVCHAGGVFGGILFLLTTRRAPMS
jgi:rhomboid family GlyGly-CTERM serine protease